MQQTYPKEKEEKFPERVARNNPESISARTVSVAWKNIGRLSVWDTGGDWETVPQKFQMGDAPCIRPPIF